jgi:hypothetical protein
MRQRAQILGGPQRPSVPGFTQIHRLIFHRNFHETVELRERIRVFVALAWNGKDDKVVTKALGIAKPM